MQEIWLSQEYAEVGTDYGNFMQDNPALAAMLNQSPCVTWILDLRCLQFVFVSSNTQALLGYDPVLFSSRGLAFVNEITHPDDLLKNWDLVRKIWDLLVAQPPAKRMHYKFTHDYRLAKASGAYLRILEQCAVLQQDRRGNITHLLGICSDITQLKKHGTLAASLLNTEDSTCRFLTPDTGNPNPQEVLSRRELEIIKLIAGGYSSKQIADSLCIGFNTVNTHRQNIIRKTKTRNTGEFVQFAIGHGLI